MQVDILHPGIQQEYLRINQKILERGVAAYKANSRHWHNGVAPELDKFNIEQLKILIAQRNLIEEKFILPLLNSQK